MTRIPILLDIVNTAKFGPGSKPCGIYFGSQREKYLIERLNLICM